LRVNAKADERAEAALALLKEAGAVPPKVRVGGFRQLQGGWSRHSFVLSVSSGGEESEFVVRVKPPGALVDSDLSQEFRTYRLLAEYGVRAPEAQALEEGAENPFGGPFFTMTKVRGRSPNVWRRQEREGLEENWSTTRSLAEDLVQSLAAIHAIPQAAVAKALPRRDFSEVVGYWRDLQEEMALVVDPVIAEAYDWLSEHAPAPVEPALVHGDYRIGNCLIDDGRITAILDWELAWFGDPRFDLGYAALDYHAGKFTSPGSNLLNSLADHEWFMREYERLSGAEVDPGVVRTHSVLGALILLAILTTGVRIYADRRSEDIRMLWSRFAIPGLRQDITRLLDW
jgi:aminoglycoside phosphotransferase (APT) family kinase protein